MSTPAATILPWGWGQPPPPVRQFFLGLDLGQAQDPSALAAVERVAFPGTNRPCSYRVGHLHRWELGTSYPAVVSGMWGLCDRPDGPKGPDGALLLQQAVLVVDSTGVGRPCVEMLRLARPGARVVPVVITGGHGATWDDASHSYHVPKKDLCIGCLALMQQDRLKFAKGLLEGPQLAKELSTFRVKVTQAATETFEGWRESDKDDLILALAVAIWYAERYPCPGTATGPAVLVPGKVDAYSEGMGEPGQQIGALGAADERGVPWWEA